MLYMVAHLADSKDSCTDSFGGNWMQSRRQRANKGWKAADIKIELRRMLIRQVNDIRRMDSNRSRADY